jgi:methylphosphotriester-DNA--protein-cysteine methyltransferase
VPAARQIDVIEFRRAVRAGEIRLAGNSKLKIYGTLNCVSGKRMNRINRVFFSSEDEAVRKGFRPCGRCMPVAYRLWRSHVRK